MAAAGLVSGSGFAALDVDYRETAAVVACVAFAAWESRAPTRELRLLLGAAPGYEPGSFYRRELPCLLAALEALPSLPAVVLVDGYVWLGVGRPGLGHHLFERFAGALAVVGVAKSRFAGAANAIPVLRGKSRVPLFVTAAGMAATEAARGVERMHGRHRTPTLLRRADALARRRESPSSP